MNLDGLGRDYSVSHAAALAAQLPQQSRCFVFVDAANAYTVADRLLEAIEYHTHAGWWKDTKDAKHGRNKPRPIGLAARGDGGKKEKSAGRAMDVSEYAAFLALPRREVDDGD